MENTSLKEKEGDYIEQLKDKNIEINGLKQQIQNMNAESKHKDFLRRQEEFDQHYNFLNQESKEIKTILDHSLKINDYNEIIDIQVKKNFKKSNPSKFNETKQEESNVTKSFEDPNFEKKYNSNVEFKKSIDNKFGSAEDILQIGVLSLTSFCQGIIDSKKK
jgi:hypothetical protein